jgi:DNA modification methylase
MQPLFSYCELYLTWIDIPAVACHKCPMDQKTITRHQFFLEDARNMSAVEDQSVHLVVTSPPYPMIEMWDEHFSASNVAIDDALSRSDADQAFELMHQELDAIWRELHRVLVPGGIACINIGDATRTIQGHFRLYANHARVIQTLQSIGFSQLPTILWRKTTNAPNKFMGSGMFPPGAYVTLEHEYILIFRKGAKREFHTDEQKSARRESAFFWEERNLWFSDVWMGLPGTIQNLNRSDVRKRSAAFPLALPYRLINMFTVKGDTVLDPFLGSGTTMLAAMCAGRNTLGYEIDPDMQPVLLEKIADVSNTAQELIDERLAAHHLFIKERAASKGDLKYVNRHYGFAVMTRQEQELCLDRVKTVQFLSGNCFTVEYVNPAAGLQPGRPHSPDKERPTEMPARPPRGRQLKLF